MNFKKWFPSIVLVLLIGGGFYGVQRKKRAIDKCSFNEEAIIIKKYKSNNRNFMKYKYEVKGETHFGTESIINKNEVGNVKIGDRINIEVACSNSSISKIVK